VRVERPSGGGGGAGDACGCGDAGDDAERDSAVANDDDDKDADDGGGGDNDGDCAVGSSCGAAAADGAVRGHGPNISHTRDFRLQLDYGKLRHSRLTR
jgi:hypothetical protein